MQTPAKAVPFLTPVGYQSGPCGYCKEKNSSQRTPNSRAQYYARSKILDVDQYQSLIDRGWRRSGSLLYKPDLHRTCCPHYTIRLPGALLQTTRDQRQALHRWNKFVTGEIFLKENAKLHPKSKEEKARQRNQFDLLDAIHASEYDRLLRPPEPAHKFEVSLEPDDFTLEKYNLYVDYQMNVHHDKRSSLSPQQFRNFLCSSPLRRSIRQVDGRTQKLGSFHQCYRLDGRLIAMSVLDLLPHSVSGVYFVYHNDFEKWSFGKLSALREAALAVEGGYQYYYMGYYIHSCVKMRYKGDYKPQYVLDPETYSWNLFDDELRELLNSKPYVSLSREGRISESGTSDFEEIKYPSAEDAATAVYGGLSTLLLEVPGVLTVEQMSREIDLDSIYLTIDGKDVNLMENLIKWEEGSILDTHTLKGLVGEFAAWVGPEVANEMIVKLR
ncbi:arginine-tRNA-protein transferase 1 [Patellaria atrata CBS 101060]|uniref:Arginyl-tRNA--protein transferase 1 n=1 Tax=Patellaria atrata CBS 101060 TaxID=1346257 RepID=A0A9P4SBC9_9PEZI|nr:arginine-tRNA-protein transferase 1 [Patellaria atrata CBS 101060]